MYCVCWLLMILRVSAGELLIEKDLDKFKEALLPRWQRMLNQVKDVFQSSGMTHVIPGHGGIEE